MAPFATWLRDHSKPALALLAALAAAITLVVVIDIDGDGPVPPITVTLAGPGPDRPLKLDQAGQDALDQAKATGVDDHQGSRSEQPDGVTPGQLDAADDQQERLAATDQLPLVAPLASPVQAGCLTRQVSNYSTRGGVRPRLFVLHYTVSPNRPGRSDVDGITAYFNSSRSQASSHYVIDNEGHCDYIVQEANKAWTQATFNPVSISVEVINTGSEATYAGTAGLAKLARVISDSTARWDIPLQRGATAGCTVTRPGVVDHASLGACGGNHGDIRPFSVEQVLDAAIAYRRSTTVPPTRLTVVEQRIVRGSTRPAGTGHSRRYWCQRNRDRRALIVRLGRGKHDGWKTANRGARYQLLSAAHAKDCR